MSSKVILNIPKDPFQQTNIVEINNKAQDTVNSDCHEIIKFTSSDPVVRANQLEQNIKFLQEQHEIMLCDLHKEIEILRRKNRDLQFQIVFSKGFNFVQSSPSSDEELQRKFSFSPGQVNITPLEIEVLEGNIMELKTKLNEAKTKNLYFQHIVEEQKKKISMLENEKVYLLMTRKKSEKENLATKTKSSSGPSENSLDILHEKLDDANRLVRRLRRENDEQRKEIVSLRTSMRKGKVDSRRNEGNGSYRNYQRNGNGQAQVTRFPPLHNHPHWRNSLDGQPCQPTNNLKKESESNRSVPALPYLRDKNNASTSAGYNNNYQSNNHKKTHYYNKKQEEHRSNGKNIRREKPHQQDNER